MNKYCKICHNKDCPNHGRDITFCGDGFKCNYIPVTTNADRIRAMSDEELARKFLVTAYRYDWKKDEDYWYFPDGITRTNYEPKAIKAWLEWLQQPVVNM